MKLIKKIVFRICPFSKKCAGLVMNMEYQLCSFKLCPLQSVRGAIKAYKKAIERRKL